MNELEKLYQDVSSKEIAFNKEVNELVEKRFNDIKNQFNGKSISECREIFSNEVLNFKNHPSKTVINLKFRRLFDQLVEKQKITDL